MIALNHFKGNINVFVGGKNQIVPKENGIPRKGLRAGRKCGNDDVVSTYNANIISGKA